MHLLVQLQSAHDVGVVKRGVCEGSSRSPKSVAASGVISGLTRRCVVCVCAKQCHSPCVAKIVTPAMNDETALRSLVKEAHHSRPKTALLWGITLGRRRIGTPGVRVGTPRCDSRCHHCVHDSATVVMAMH
eukprot:m.47634 g.47634  ORF g.47634 m.47634 type:complete len:131 (+) comp15667_c0_seq1:941-1333(+)